MDINEKGEKTYNIIEVRQILIEYFNKFPGTKGKDIFRELEMDPFLLKLNQMSSGNSRITQSELFGMKEEMKVMIERGNLSDHTGYEV